MKKLVIIVLSIVLLLSLTATVLADSPCLVDDADLLTDTEESIIVDELNEVSQKWNMDAVIVTVDSLQGSTPNAFADDYFDDNGYGAGSDRSGILLLISMEDRDWAISTSGNGIQVFTDAGQEYLMDEVLLYLSDDDFYNGFMQYAELCDDYCRQASEGEPYDVDNLPQGSFPFLILIAISLVIGLIAALIVTGVMKGQLKSIRAQNAAADYMTAGSLKVTESRDLFLYRNVTRQPKPKQNSGGSSVHTSSSGRVHGGSSGKF